MDAELEADLRIVRDKQEIYDVHMRYCRGIDRLDADLIKSCYHPDGIDDHGTPIRAWDMADRMVAAPIRHKMSMHFIGNVLTDVEGDVAFSECYCIAYLTLEPHDGLLDVGGKTIKPSVLANEYDRALGLRYIDRFERRDGRWKIAHRIVVDEWHRADPVNEPAPGSTHGRQGLRSTSDPVYRFRAGELATPHI